MKLYLLLIYAVYNSVSESDLCKYHTCGECISNANCVWCVADEMKGDDKSRCMPVSILRTKNNWCDKNSIENPTLLNNVTLNKSFDEQINGVQVQFRPQNINIKARPGVIIPITMSYKPAKDYPLDVYYLMDISYTMKSLKTDLWEQASEIYKELTSYTNNVRLGIGSFVEKPAFPYVDTIKKNPHISHAFKNHLSLTTDVAAFGKTVEGITFGANYDDPEAGLDALMQVMTCEKELGWRPGARKIIVLCTDSTYHSAGDGRVLGVIRPNDMQCHVNKDEYNSTMALTYDYPSVSQINKVAKDGNFIIIFATKKVVATEYIKLAKHILGAKYANLESKKDAVEIIKNAYKESTQTINLSHDLPQFIQLTLDQNCQTKPTRNCESTAEQKTVNINGNLTVIYCPPDGKLKQELSIQVVGIKDKLSITLDIDCKCACENDPGIRDYKCNNAGAFQCGICKCDPGRYGVDCRCNGTSTDIIDIEKCKLPGDKMLCSGRGTCRCGKCEMCQTGFSGDVCQYDDNSCPENCNNNGICTLGRCHCKAYWAGEDCSCSLKDDNCIAPYSKTICSGNGHCHCGKCECNKMVGDNGTDYSGVYCDACDDCAEKRCKELENYVVCNLESSKAECDQQYNITNTIVERVNKSELNSHAWNKGIWCRTRRDDGFVIFKYQYEDLNLHLGIQNELELPDKANIFIAVGSAIGLVLLIGIVTLIVWKILVDLHDKREYERFAKETEEQNNGVFENVLYTPPNVCINNPTFHK